MSAHARLAVPLSLVLLVGGCALTLRSPSIAELKTNPGRYYDKTVSVNGVVTSAWGVPLLPYKMYRVDDGTGELVVVADGGRVPTRGAHVRVRGKVGEFAVVGGRSFGLHLREDDLHIKRN